MRQFIVNLPKFGDITETKFDIKYKIPFWNAT